MKTKRKTVDLTALNDQSLDGEVFKLYENDNIDKGRFYISNYARCWDNVEGEFLTENENDEYMRWNCKSSSKDRSLKKYVIIHRAVAELFIPIPKNKKGKLVVDHIDGCKHNNSADNLRWLTYSENARAQDVQQRKVASFKRTQSEKRQVETLIDSLANAHDRIRSLQEEVKSLGEILKDAHRRKEEAEKSSLEAYEEANQWKGMLDKKTSENETLRATIRGLEEDNRGLSEKLLLQEEKTKAEGKRYDILKCEFVEKCGQIAKLEKQVGYFDSLVTEEKSKVLKLKIERETFMQKVIDDSAKMMAEALKIMHLSLNHPVPDPSEIPQSPLYSVDDGIGRLKEEIAKSGLSEGTND